MVIRLLLLFSFWPPILQAQVLNIDRENKDDSIFRRWDIAIGLSLSSDKQKSNLLESSSNVETILNLRSKYFVASVLKNELSYNGPTEIQNEGLVHFRFRDRDTRASSCEVYLQSLWNGQWGLAYRNSINAGYRKRLLERKGYDFYMSLGVLLESERWNWNGVSPALLPPVIKDVFSTQWRINHQTKFSYRASEWVDFSLISYLQPSVTPSKMIPRWVVDANTYIKAGEKINVVLHWDHILDKNVIVPIDKFFYGFSVGVQHSNRK
jgi:hypothetical protein